MKKGREGRRSTRFAKFMTFAIKAKLVFSPFMGLGNLRILYEKRKA